MNFNDLKIKAHQLDATDPLKKFRQFFKLPSGTLLPHKIYLCNNSLGLPPCSAFSTMKTQMQKWSDLGAQGWFTGSDNWYASLDKPLRDPLSTLLGANYDEVIVMNSLTINLHLMLVSFFTPTTERYKILIDAPTFPSDLYAIKSHLSYHGLDPDESLLIVKPRPNEYLLREEDIQQIILEEGKNICLVFLNSVNFLTGQSLNIKKITKLAQLQGCIVGFDIAHAAGNVLLNLHDDHVDFAVGCSYKYLCSGPGGPGIAFVHSSHHKKILPRFSGWWGNDPNIRFQIDSENEFTPYIGAYGWQVSTPSILASMPFIESLQLFSEAGMDNLRKKSQLQTAFLLELLARIKGDFNIITPTRPAERGCQISLQFPHNAENYLKKLLKMEVICDFRRPDIIRVSPAPMYNTFEEIYQFSMRFSSILKHIP